MTRKARTSATPFAWLVALLLLSGFCALVYQVAWLRLLRLVFGASTAASATVLAIFLGGLGLGGLMLGKRADRARRPLMLYAKLELGIALLAGLSPLLVTGVHRLYVSLGGVAALGPVLATLVRIGLAAVVLGGTTFLMGGTLPAIARAVTPGLDGARRRWAWLYGANSLGAVLGALSTTFVAIEWLGVRDTVLVAAGLNLLLAVIAAWLARRAAPRIPSEPAADSSKAESSKAGQPPAPTTVASGLVLAAAAIVGFAFLLLELIWYRMLAPMLGGTSYTFGLILAVALAGIAIGGALYASLASRLRPTLALFGAVCALEALVAILPLALGDRLAVLAMLLRPLGDIDFWLLTAAWTGLTALVVAPAAVVAGFQFPLLVALLGRGARDVGRHVGTAYAWNTAGAILGALVGGFVLIPAWGAVGAWRAVAMLLVALAAAATALDAARRRTFDRWHGLVASAVALTLVATAATGPTAVWRHTPIGAGGMPAAFSGANDLRNMRQAVRRAIVWERDGRESSVAIHALDEISFLINGKADGSALKDAPTQVLSGLIGAAFHPRPERALVIGLGTGSSAGWLAAVPGIEQVDVVELEPAILEVAERCAAVNRNVLEAPNVDVIIGDGRELLLSTESRYDVIFSEPSNPYRAGISSLFTREFYRAARDRLTENGIFLQWLQGYEVDSGVVRTVLATLRSEIGTVEIWQSHTNDLLLVASAHRLDHDLSRLASRLAEEPFASALAHTLGSTGIYGFYTGFVARPSLATDVLDAERGRLNTDDHPRIEFGFARGLGRDLEFSIERLTRLAHARGEAFPQVRRGRIEPLRLAEARSIRNAHWGIVTRYPPTGDAGFDTRVEARNDYVRGDLASAMSRWSEQDRAPESIFDLRLLAESLSAGGDARAGALAATLEREGDRFGAAVTRSRLAFSRGDLATAAAALANAFVLARDEPWLSRPMLDRALSFATEIATESPVESEVLFEALGIPFAVHVLDDFRLRTRLALALMTAFEARCQAALAPFEDHFPWERDLLTARLRCYQATADPRLSVAQADFEAFLVEAPPSLAPDA